MRCFLAHYTLAAGKAGAVAIPAVAVAASAQDVVCDEEAIDQVRP
jgi:hypothetical protein